MTTDAVHRPARRFPRVVRRARPERALVGDGPRIPADLLGALGVAQQVRVVALLPHEDEVCGGHELCDELAPRRRARKRVGGDAEPAGVVGVGVVGPELFLFEELLLLEQLRIVEGHALG